MRVSVVLGSNRPGGVDIAFAGLAKQTFTDFEIIFVDGRYHLRHEKVLDCYKQYEIQQPLYHVPNHRNRSDIWGVTCAGYNTSFMLASGEIVIMLLDYAYVPPGWIESHLKYQDGKRVIMGPHEYRIMNNSILKTGESDLIDFVHGKPETTIENILAQWKRFEEISIFPEPFTSDKLDTFEVDHPWDPKLKLDTGVSTWNYFHTKNESFPLANIIEVNGMDENYDRGRGPGDHDIGYRLERSGLVSWVVAEAKATCINPRGILPNLNTVIPVNEHLPPPYEKRWHHEEGHAYFQRCKDDGLRTANNPYSLRDMREKIWPWRELSQRREPVIPRCLIEDEEYYKELK